MRGGGRSRKERGEDEGEGGEERQGRSGGVVLWLVHNWKNRVLLISC